MENLKKLFVSFGFQGAAFGALGVIISLFVVVDLGGNVANASVASAFYALGNLIGSMIVGIILDKYSIFFEMVFLSAVADAAISVAMAFVTSIFIYYILALGLGIFAAIMGPAITIYLNKKFNEDGYRKKVNTMNLFNSVGVTVGTFVGGFWLSYFTLISNNSERMRWIFIIATLLLATSSILSSAYLKKHEFLKTFKSRRIFPNFHSLSDHVAALPHNILLPFKFAGFKTESKKYMMSIFLIFFGANMIFSIFSIYLKNILKIDSGMIFIIYGLNNILTNTAYFLTTGLMKKFKDSLLVRSALLTRVVLFSMIAVSGYFLPFGVWTTVLAFLIIGFTWPLFYIPTTVHVTDLALPTDRGRIIGMFNSVINFAVIAASFISGYIALEFGYITAFIFGIVFLFFGERFIYKLNTAMPVSKGNFVNTITSPDDKLKSDVTLGEK